MGPQTGNITTELKTKNRLTQKIRLVSQSVEVQPYNHVPMEKESPLFFSLQ